MQRNPSLHPAALLAVSLLALGGDPRAVGVHAQARQAAPPGSNAPVMLPDIVGVRLGMPIQDAYNVMRAHDRQSKLDAAQVSVPPIGAKPIPVVLQLGTLNVSPDVVQAEITMPPGNQVVWRVVRQLRFERGAEQAPAPLVAGLREKYGPESFAGPGRGTYTWVFDEQGRRTTGITFNSDSYRDCASFFALPNMSSHLEPGGNIAYRILGMIVDGLQPNQRPCRLVAVIALLAPGLASADLVSSLTMSAASPLLGVTAEQATRAVLANADAEAKKRELDKAAQQPKPKF